MGTLMAYGGRLIRNIGSSVFTNETSSSIDDSFQPNSEEKVKDAVLTANNTSTQWTGTNLLLDLELFLDKIVSETIQGRCK